MRNLIMTDYDNLKIGLETAFINGSQNSMLAYRPQFVSNNYVEGQKVLSTLEDELLVCDEFYISVAFITMSGITPLLQTLKQLEEKHIPGKILTTDYLHFSEPRALEKLSQLSNIELKMYITDGEQEGFHTKGYIFRKEEIYRILVGSSNMTMSALTTNKEWNTKIVSKKQGEFTQNILNEFKQFWYSDQSRPYDTVAQYYDTYYRISKNQRDIAKQNKIVSFGAFKLKPNSMQVGFINSLKEMIEAGEKRALLISATGTGKTYASAFAMRELGFKRVLFVVHRNQICRQAKKSFETVFGSSIRTGLVSGQGGLDDDYKADFVFATVQTLSKPENLKRFSKEYFSACVYDEAHHTSADSYKRIMDYFNPDFTLGMTATPDKRDDNIEGRNIYELYEHNIAYEIRLQQAMEEKLLCPFHYFGITDLNLISDEGKTKEEKLENFRYLTSEDRVSYIMEQAEYFGYSGNRVKGLIFCSRVDEAKELSRKFNARGLKTMCLSGSDGENIREEAIDLLTREVDTENYDVNEYGVKTYYTIETSNNRSWQSKHNIVNRNKKEQDYLDYIITVDIFSEGVDIVEINQVIMLRPTQSPIVFIQQLGRGLRKADEKEYVVILDFIGNYKNNFMIPIALSGDRTYNKDNIRRYLMEGGRVIPGASTIHFDEVSKKRIFAAVDNANFSDIKLIKENYKNLKDKLGRIPKLLDFDVFGEMDVLRIFDNKSLGSYYKFLVKYEKEYKIRLSADEEQIIEFVSKKLANGKRVQELELLRRIMIYARRTFKNKVDKNKYSLMDDLKEIMLEQYGRSIDQIQEENLINVMTNEFPSSAAKKTYTKCIFIEPEKKSIYKNTTIKEGYPYVEYKPESAFLKMLLNDDFYNILYELVEFGIHRNKRDYIHTYQNTDFVLYQKYTYEDVCRLLNWENNEVPLNIGGYKYDKKTKTFPVFINYDKEEDISDTTKYEDHFTSQKTLIAISKSGRSLQSEDVQNFLRAKERGISVELFVRKNKDDKISKEFYYLGRMEASGKAEEFTMTNTTKTAVEIEWILDVPVREDLYEYIVNG